MSFTFGGPRGRYRPPGGKPAAPPSLSSIGSPVSVGRPSGGNPTNSSPAVSRPPVAVASRATFTGGLGKGKGAIGLGTKGMLKRHKKVQRDSIQGISKGDIRRIARRGGVKRISGTIYDDIRDALKTRIQVILRNVIPVLDSGNRKTVVTRDVIYALNRLGTPIYGFDAAFDGRER